MEIKRDRYLSRLIARKNNGMVKVVTGIRRCGKTYLLFNLFIDHLTSAGVDSEHIIAMALDAEENMDLRDPKSLLSNISAKITDDGQYYVILDEIQMVPKFESVINSLLHRENLDIYVTGSNSKFLSSDIITEFRGRGDEIRVRPLSFSEFLSGSGKDKCDSLTDYMDYGGLPEILSLSDDEQKISYLKNVFETTYLIDIEEKNDVRKQYLLDNLTNVLSSSIGSLVNLTKIKNTMISSGYKSADEDTIKKYVGYLENSFLFEKAKRYDIKGRRYISSSEKYYCADQGLSNARLGFRQISDRPHIMENIVFNELKSRGYEVDVGMVRTRERKDGSSLSIQTEIDFVARKGSRMYYIQSAYSLQNRKNEELRPLLKTGDSFKKIVITADMMHPHMDDSGIMFVGLIQFLLDENIMDYRCKSV